MSVSRVSAGVGALALSGMALVGLATPASAQAAPAACAQGVLEAYPPGQTQQAVSDSTPNRGQLISACVRGFKPSSSFEFGVESTYMKLGTGTVNAGGVANASFNVPTTISLGPHSVVFIGTRNGAPATVRIPINVQGNQASGPVGGLPRTGSDEIVPLTAAGLGLVAAGAGLVVLARRHRRESKNLLSPGAGLS